MVINSHHKFIFLHIPKAAGTSIMKSLKKVPGNESHWLANTKHETLAEFHKNIEQRRTLKDKLLRKTPVDYFTFGFVRNPWDRMSSFYRYLVEKRPKKEIDTVTSFKDFLEQAGSGVEWTQNLYSMKSQLDYFTLPDGTMNIDYLGHFEYLPEDLEQISKQIGVQIKLSHHNKSTNTGLDYRKQYDDEMIEFVRNRFAEEIEFFSYSFEDRYPGNRVSSSLTRKR